MMHTVRSNIQRHGTGYCFIGPFDFVSRSVLPPHSRTRLVGIQKFGTLELVLQAIFFLQAILLRSYVVEGSVIRLVLCIVE